MTPLAEIASANPGTGTAAYYAHDHLGSTRGLYNASKTSVATTEYEPYGMMTSASTGTPAYRYTGKPWADEVDMYHFPYRYYNANAGRWLTRDPLGMVDGPNLYGYVTMNPVVFQDSLGLFTKKECRDVCKRIFKKPKLQQQCMFLCGDLGGCTCLALDAFCNHIGRHPSEFHNNAHKQCRLLYIDLCLGK